MKWNFLLASALAALAPFQPIASAAPEAVAAAKDRVHIVPQRIDATLARMVLKPHTVRLMSSDQLDPSITERDWLPGKGNGGFGIDFFVRTGRPLDARENRGAAGEFFWDGGLSTLFWVDPANDMAVVFMVQKAPFDGTLHHDIREAVYGADYLGPPGN